MIKKLLLGVFLCVSAYANADVIKIAHTGIPHHDAIIRHLTNNEATVVSKPGAKGLIAFQALENKEVDFIVTSSSPLYITDKDFFGFDPIKKFKVIGSIVHVQGAVYLSPKFTSLNDLKTSKNEILHASGGEEAEQFISSLFPKNKVIHVNYKGIGQQLVDVKQGLADITFIAEPMIIAFGEEPIKTDFVFKVHLVTRHDVDEKTIAKLISNMEENARSEKTTSFFTKTKSKFVKLKRM